MGNTREPRRKQSPSGGLHRDWVISMIQRADYSTILPAEKPGSPETLIQADDATNACTGRAMSRNSLTSVVRRILILPNNLQKDQKRSPLAYDLRGCFWLCRVPRSVDRPRQGRRLFGRHEIKTLHKPQSSTGKYPASKLP